MRFLNTRAITPLIELWCRINCATMKYLFTLLVSILVFGCDGSVQEVAESRQAGTIRKPQMSDTIRANVYADNWFSLYVNGAGCGRFD